MKLFTKLRKAVDKAEQLTNQALMGSLKMQLDLLMNEKTPIGVKYAVLPLVWDKLPRHVAGLSQGIISKNAKNQRELVVLLKENKFLETEYFQAPFKVGE